MALRGDMALQTIVGAKKISELSDRTVLNPDHTELAFVLSGGSFFVAEVGDFRSVGQEQVFAVELDDGNVLHVSPSSQLVMRTGRLKLPPELKPGDSLMPLYLDEDAHGYPTYRVPGRAVKRKISRLIAEWKLGHKLGKGTYVEHIDGDRKNCHPDNLKISINEKMAKRSHKNKVVTAVEALQTLLDECAAASPKMAKIIGKRTKRNHKVSRITPGRLEEVYTASVRSVGSLSVSGVFVQSPRLHCMRQAEEI